MKKINTLFCGLLLVTSLAGCQNSGKANEASARTTPEPERVIVMGIDDTGSYELWDQAKNIACQIIWQLQPGDIFYLRRITAESYTDKCTVFRLEIPRMQKSLSDNPFDRKAKRQKRVFEIRITALKQEAIQQIGNLKRQGAKKTDIFGFLAVATEKFSLTEKNARPIVIMATDLQDNVSWKPTLDLSNAKVVIVGFQVMKDPKKTQAFKRRWAGLFKKTGATHTLFVRAEERFDLNKI
jgi:hypothetical protein